MQKTYKNKCVLVQKMDIIKIKEQTRKEVWDLYTLCEHELHNLKVYVDEEIPISKDTFLSMRNIKTNLINHIEEAYNLLKDRNDFSIFMACYNGSEKFIKQKTEQWKIKKDSFNELIKILEEKNDN